MPSPTAVPRPTKESPSTATPIPTPEEERVIKGWGNFPRLPVVAPASDGHTLALYLVEADTATQLVVFEETHVYNNLAVVQLSPGGRHIASMLLYTITPTLELVDTQDPRRVVLYESAWDPSLGGGKGEGAFVDQVTSFAWLDDEHVLYTTMKWIDWEECRDRQMAGESCAVPGEIWLTNLLGEKQLLLAGDRIHSVLGASRDGQQVYFTRYAPTWDWGAQDEWVELSALELDSGTVQFLWPQEGHSGRYLSFKLIFLPDGTQRVLFTTFREQPPVVGMLDLQTGQVEMIWACDQVPYPDNTPAVFLPSPHSAHTFVYQTWGVRGQLWWVDTAASQARKLGEGCGLLAWTAEGIVTDQEEEQQGLTGFYLKLLDETGEVQGEIRNTP